MRYADSQCQVEEQYQPEHTYSFVGPCVVTGKEQRVTVKAEDLNRYRLGGHVQLPKQHASCARYRAHFIRLLGALPRGHVCRLQCLGSTR